MYIFICSSLVLLCLLFFCYSFSGRCFCLLKGRVIGALSADDSGGGGGGGYRPGSFRTPGKTPFFSPSGNQLSSKTDAVMINQDDTAGIF